VISGHREYEFGSTWVQPPNLLLEENIMTDKMHEEIDQDRRSLLGAAATGIAIAGAATLFPSAAAATVQSDAIRPFRIEIPESELDDLRRRLKMARLPEKETVADFSQGVPLKTVQQLLRHWQTEYDWRKVEARLNSYPQFVTEIDGLDIHFMHIRSKHENALPIIITHGWPGSVVEQLKIIEPLTNPTAHGGSAADAFHVIIPSMPGYAFSGKPATTGWGPERIAAAWTTLMQRLGYKQYVAQGGDWGSVVTEMMAVKAPKELLGIHVNMPGAVPVDVNGASFSGAPAPDGLNAEEKATYDQLVFFYQHVYYAFWMGTRPQTAAALSDSPIGLATFLLDHDARSLEMIARSFDGQSEGMTPDDVLDNVTLFWLTNTGVSSARLYWENKLPFFTPKGVTIPVAVTTFPDELYATPREWAERAFPNLIHYNKVEKGGHFAAWEQPKLLTDELRVSFRSLRTS
jgi:pimeloyl-ACP methyl ester carboxylesterase